MGERREGDVGEPRRWARALVTGASSGIGESMCRQMAANGTDLVVVARNCEQLESLATELRARSGVRVEVLPADLASSAGQRVVEDRVEATDESVELVVNNAGFGFNGAFGDVERDDEDAELQVNVVALMRICHAAVGRMHSQGWGGILNVSSVASFQPTPGGANYGASKAYVTSFTLALHEELREAGVHVSVLCPGLTRTGFQERNGWNDETPGILWQNADEVAAAGLSGVASNRAMVVPGIHNRGVHLATKVVPGAALRRIAALASSRMG
jgi:short-subunit dehydrogenase